MQIRVLISIALSVIISGCSVSKKREADAFFDKEGGDLRSVAIAEVLKYNITNRNFNIERADIRISQGRVSVRFTASLKFRKPDSLMITVRSRAGIEAGRALITSDTILVNDRINRTLLIGKPEIIGPKYGIEPGLLYAVLGDLIIGEHNSDHAFKCNNGFFSDNFEMYNRRVVYTIDCREKKAVKSYFEGGITSGNITAQFDEIRSINNVKYPGKILINDDKESMDIFIEIKKIEIPWEGRIKFIPGSNYKVLRIR